MSKLTEKLSVYGVNIPAVLERFVGDEEMYYHCLNLFIDDKAFSELGYALDTGDYKTAFEKAHSLKGVSANLGLKPLFDAICDIVDPLRTGKTQGLDELYGNVMKALEQVKALMKQEI